MKVNIEIDCTPLEAREFLGLPDVQPIQKAMMDKMSHRPKEFGDAKEPLNEV